MTEEIGDPCKTCGSPIVWVDYGEDNGSLCLKCYKNNDLADGPFQSWEGMVKTMFKESVKILLDNSLTDLEWTYAKNCIHTGLRYFESKRMDEKLTPKRPARDFNEFLLQFVNYLDTFKNQIVIEDCEKFGGRATSESTKLVIETNEFEDHIKEFLKARGIPIEKLSTTTSEAY